MIGAIVLAAGSSRRFGDDKRKATLANGKLVLQQSVEHALACFDEVMLVLRYGDNEFAAELPALIKDPKLTIFQAPDSALGMGHSLANAIQQVEDWEAAFVFLADMPFIKPDTLVTLKSLISTEVADQQSVSATGMTGGVIVVPVYGGQYGHPVGFTSNYFGELAALTGDKGAKPVINAHKGHVTEVSVEDAGVLKDVDTPEDL